MPRLPMDGWMGNWKLDEESTKIYRVERTDGDLGDGSIDGWMDGCVIGAGAEGDTTTSSEHRWLVRWSDDDESQQVDLNIIAMMVKSFLLLRRLHTVLFPFFIATRTSLGTSHQMTTMTKMTMIMSISGRREKGKVS